MSQPASRRFRLVWSEETRQAWKLLGTQALRVGRADSYLAATHVITEKLESEPLVAGEPIHDLRALNLHVRKIVVAPISLQHAVHEEQRLVFVQRLTLLSLQP